MPPTKRRSLLASALLLSLSPLAVSAQTVTSATLIQTIHTSLWSPASPDPSCTTWRAETQDFWTTDNEVDEMTIFGGVTLWRHDGAGVVSQTFDLTGFTNEPSGLFFDPAGDRVWISDDNAKKIWQVHFGVDGEFGTTDDVVEDIDGISAAGCDDPEDVTYNPFTNQLYVSSVDSHEICTISPGPNGGFDDAAPMGDDVVTTFDTWPLGIRKPKGVYFDAVANTLVVADRGDPAIGYPRDFYELTTGGTLLRRIDGTVPGGYKLSGVTMAPSSVNPALRSYWISDNGTDNGANPLENDGRIHEFVAAPYAGNGAPVVEAGSPQTITWPNDTVTLAGYVGDDGHPYPPSALVSEWTLTSGPGSVSFGDAGEPATTATFSAPGVYVLALEGDDFALTSSDTVEITVDEPPSYELAVDVIGAGVVAIDPPAGPYAEGSVVTLTATATPPFRFDHWSGDLGGTTSPASITMSADRVVAAHFTSTGGGGGGGCGIGPELAGLMPALLALRRRRRT